MPSDRPDDGPLRTDSQTIPRRRFLRFGSGALLASLAGCTGASDDPVTRQASTTTDALTTAPTTSSTGRDTATEPNGPWPTIRADSANTGSVAAAGPEGTPAVHWTERVRLATTVRATTGPNGAVATRRDGLLVAYDAGGTERWRRRHDGGFAAAPVVGPDGTVVVGSRDGTVAAYESDGTRRWQHETQRGLLAPHVNDATPFRIRDDTVILAHPRGRVVAYALADGAERWTAEAPGRTHRPAIAGGRAFLASRHPDDRNRGLVRALSLADGSERWREDTPGTLSIGLGHDQGVVYAADIDGRVLALDAADGTERWRVRLDGEPWLSTIPVAFGDRVWVGTLSDGLYAVTEDGVQAHVDLGTPTTPAVGDGRLYVGSTEFGSDGGGDRAGTVLAIDDEGDTVWRRPTRGYPDAQVRYRDGRVAFGTDTGVVERVAAGDGSRDWRSFERPSRLPAPVVGPRTVYCGSRDDDVGGYRVTDGTDHLWSVSYDGRADRAPAVAGQTVLAGSRAGDLAGTPLLEHAERPAGRLTRTPTTDGTTTHIDAPAPEPRWRTMLDGPIGDVGYGTDSAYLGSGTTVASVTADGDLRWETDVDARVRSAPAVGDGVVYAATTDGTVLALTADDGTVRWRRSVGEAATAPALIDFDGTPTLVIGTNAAAVALDASDGTERWRTETARVRGAPAVTGDRVVVGDEAGVLRGLDLGDGTERWRVETGGQIRGSLAIADGVAYVGSRDRHLYAVSAADGSIRWRVELRDWVDGSPAVAYGAVFVVDQSGTLSAVVGDQ